MPQDQFPQMTPTKEMVEQQPTTNINKLVIMLLLGVTPHVEPLISMTESTWKSVVTSAILSIVGMLVAYFSNPSGPITIIPQSIKNR